MAYYEPDFEYIKGMKALEELKTSEADSIRYYVKNKDKYIDKYIDRLRRQIDEMQKVFDGIKKFTNY